MFSVVTDYFHVLVLRVYYFHVCLLFSCLCPWSTYLEYLPSVSDILSKFVMNI